MYLRHFDLREYPFGLTPNTQFFCALPPHQEALNVLVIALKSGEGFIKITGEVGTGKTLLCRKLLNELGDGFSTAYIPNPALSPKELLTTLADELGLRNTGAQAEGSLLKMVYQRVVAVAKAGKRLVLVLDEAQAMPAETLEMLRLLTNFETETDKLLQIALFGQPELDGMLARPALRQLLQRITFSHHLLPLTASETQRYLFNRLRIAGFAERDLFTWPACRLLHYASRGVPRLINVLAHKALLSAYGKGGRQVRLAHVWAAMRDTEGARQASLFPFALATLTLGAAAGLGIWLYWRGLFPV